MTPLKPFTEGQAGAQCFAGVQAAQREGERKRRAEEGGPEHGELFLPVQTRRAHMMDGTDPLPPSLVFVLTNSSSLLAGVVGR